jgi:hypothetical protein
MIIRFLNCGQVLLSDFRLATNAMWILLLELNGGDRFLTGNTTTTEKLACFFIRGKRHQTGWKGARIVRFDLDFDESKAILFCN